MRKEFLVGMVAAPVLFLLYLGIGALLKSAPEISDDEKEDYLMELNYSRDEVKNIIPTLAVKTPDKDGFKEIRLEDLKGKPTIIHFWATWCKPCTFEMPEFSKFAKEYGSKFNILTINCDQAETAEEAHEIATKYIKENGYTHLKVAYDPKFELTRAMKAKGWPTTILLDKDGKEIGRFNGVLIWNDPRVIMTIKSLFN